MDQVRRVLEQQAALVQGLEHQRDIALLKIADAAVYQFRAAAGCALGEIMLLDEQRFISARRPLDRRAQPRRSTANHNDVPDFRWVLNFLDGLAAVHG